MRIINALSSLLFVCFFLILSSCGKEEVIPQQTNPKNFYRLNTFEVDVTPKFRQVKILFQVTDFNHDGVSTITEESLDVFENGGRIDLEGDLTITRDSTPYRIRTVLLLDLTRSVEGLVEQIKTASIAMINQKLPDQEIAIYIFDANTRKVKDFTNDKQELITAIQSIPETDLVNSTNLYGAVRDVADLWQDSYTIDAITDGSVIIFTDGRHNATPNITLNDALAALDGKKRFVAALNSPDLDETSLKLLAEKEERYFKANDVTGLETMFLDIQAEIQRLSNSIYYMYYQSPITDPTPHVNELRIEVKNNSNRGNDRLLEETFNSDGFGL